MTRFLAEEALGLLMQPSAAPRIGGLWGPVARSEAGALAATLSPPTRLAAGAHLSMARFHAAWPVHAAVRAAPMHGGTARAQLHAATHYGPDGLLKDVSVAAAAVPASPDVPESIAAGRDFGAEAGFFTAQGGAAAAATRAGGAAPGGEAAGAQAAAAPGNGPASLAGVVPQGQALDFTASGLSVTGGALPSLSYTIPSEFFQSQSLQGGFGTDGFNADFSASVMAGIKGSVSIGLGSFAPNIPLTINPGALADVQDGQLFQVDPSLVSTNDESFSLSLAHAMASLEFGLQVQASLELGLPSFQNPLTSSVISLGTINAPLSAGDLYTLPQNATENVPGGTVSLTEIQAQTVTSNSYSKLYGLPAMTISAETKPFLSGNVDLVSFLANYVPDLKAVSGSVDFGIGKASYNVLSLPLSVSLSLGESLTVTPGQITEIATCNGQTQTGTLGMPLTFAAPDSGSGTLAVQITYVMQLNVTFELDLDGNLSLSLDGPSASATAFGEGGSIGPLGSVSLLNLSGKIATLYEHSFGETLTSSSTTDIAYGPNFATETLSTFSSTGVRLGSAGAQLDITASGQIIAGSYGVESSTLGTAAVTNQGGIVAGSGTSFNEIDGIVLLDGGTVNNQAGGVILAQGAAYGAGVQAFENGSVFGPGVQVTNAGMIMNFYNGVALGLGSVTNAVSGVISAQKYGVALIPGSPSSRDQVINAGTIKAQIGVDIRNGYGGVLNAAGALIDGTQYGISASAPATIANYGTVIGAIGVSANAYSLGEQLNVSVLNGAGATITDRGATAIVLRGQNTTLANAGTIIGGGIAAQLSGSLSNTLVLTAGETIQGEVIATAGQGNAILLGAGSSVGTLNGLGIAYSGFTTVSVATGAAWDIETNSAELTGVTLSGFNTGDTLNLLDLAFQPGETAKLDRQTGMLRLFGANGSVISSIALNPAAGVDGFAVSAASRGVDITALAANHYLNAPSAGIILSQNGYYGETLTIGAHGTVSSNAYSGEITPSGITGASPFVASLTNGGTITGVQYGVSLAAGGTIINQAHGVIAGGVAAVSGGDFLYVKNEAGAVITAATGTAIENASQIENAGEISGQIGIMLQAGSGLVNEAAGTITANGNALLADSQAFVTNAGLIEGGAASLFLGGAVIDNTGSIINLAAGGAYALSIAGAGEIANSGHIGGIVMSGGSTLVNASGGIIAGGGHYGAVLSGAVQLSNSGTIDGLSLNGGSATNAGVILGGATALAASGATVTNDGTISAASGLGVSLTAASSLANLGKIQGGTGVSVTAATLTNYGVIAGNATGVSLASGILTNIGTISGNTALYAQGAAVLTNSGQILGMALGAELAGGATLTNAAGGTISGAAGVLLNGGTLHNHGGVVIGTGGIAVRSYGNSYLGNLGSIGAVVQISGALSVVNAGTVASLTLLADSVVHNAATIGSVEMGGGMFTNSGTVSGSAAFALNGGTLMDSGLIASTSGTALIAADGATLELLGRQRFTGSVIGSAGATLLLAGSKAASLTGLGSAIAGFGTVAVAAGADWALKGIDTLGGTLLDAGTLALATGLAGEGGITVSAGAVLSGKGAIGAHLALSNAGLIEAAGGTLKLNGQIANSGTLAAAAGAVLALSGGGTLSGSVAGAGTLLVAKSLALNDAALSIGTTDIAAGATLSGAGTLTGTLANAGTILARGGTLTLDAALPAGLLEAAAGAVLDLAGGGTLTGTLAGPGRINLETVLHLGNGAMLAGHDMLDTAAFTVAAGGTAQVAASGVLTLEASKGATLQTGGGGALSVAGSLAASGGGSITVSGAFIDAGHVSLSKGTLSFLGPVTNNGTISAAGGTLSIAHSVSGTGALAVSGGAVLALQAGSGVGQSVDFLAANGLVELGAPSLFHGTIAGFAAGDTLSLLATTATEAVLKGEVLQIYDGATLTAGIHLSGAYTNADFALTESGGNAVISFV